ncbi:alanine racemase [Thermorudis peleae]|uniref:alanine racemase n=1 Tax=Thermorudis peleae TaxID=1382356 RepID=UPI0006892D7B|nr:alanine racemase [Thermorudis peleae]
MDELTPEARVAAARTGTHAVIDLDRLAANAATFRARLPADTALMAVVKANAYGHGLVPCARAFLDGGATWLGVARIEEGLVLREAGITAPIVVLGPPNYARVASALQANVQLAVGSLEDVHVVQAAARQVGRQAAVHLKVDTGMHRFGVEPAIALDVAHAIVSTPETRLAGLFTHFASADAPGSSLLRKQVERFRTVRQQLADAGIVPETVHQANSAATIQGLLGDASLPGQRLARCGIALYGLSPSPDVPVPEGVRPALQLWSRVARVFRVQPGEGISYGPAFIADRPMLCALVPIGYGDGLLRALSNRGWMATHGQRCPIRGRICMDQTIIELPAPLQHLDDLDTAGSLAFEATQHATRLPQSSAPHPDRNESVSQDMPEPERSHASRDGKQGPAQAMTAACGVRIGDDVLVLGDGRAGAMTAEDAAILADTIPYEIVTALAARVPRLFIRNGLVVALSDMHGTVAFTADPVPLPPSS